MLCFDRPKYDMKTNDNEMTKLYGLNSGPMLIFSGLNGGPMLIFSGFNSRTLFVTPVNGLAV